VPELAEVEFYRKQWDPGLGEKIETVQVHPKSRVFRGGTDPNIISKSLSGHTFKASFTHGKNMLFQFSGDVWLSGHLGMTGKLFTLPRSPSGASDTALPSGILHRPGASAEKNPKHNHLVIVQKRRSLVFCDPRMFGLIQLHTGKKAPRLWRGLPPEILSSDYTKTLLKTFLKRHPRALIKPLLLDQTGFPGIGNWMADEILWRTRIDPLTPVGTIPDETVALLWRATRKLTREALRGIGTDWSRPPDHWLFNHRWADGGYCPRPECNAPLVRKSLRGRTTCWCPTCQER